MQLYEKILCNHELEYFKNENLKMQHIFIFGTATGYEYQLPNKKYFSTFDSLAG